MSFQWKNVLTGSIAFALVLISIASVSAADQTFSVNTKSAVVFIANYDRAGDFTGWGSGFFVDEGIVVTNRHVIEGGYYYRVFATGADDRVDLNCYRTLTRSDVKINLDDDVAYMRAYVDCPHGQMYFASADANIGDDVALLGYPSRGTTEESLALFNSAGTVTGKGNGIWMTTDAIVDFGNSGGPLVQNDKVVGVVVAKNVDAEGNFVSGLFIPSSEIMKGLKYANDSTFGYVPQENQNNSAYPAEELSSPKTNEDCARLLGEGSQMADNGGCKCATGYKKNSTGTMCTLSSAYAQSSSSSAASYSSRSSRSSSSSSRSFSSSSSRSSISSSGGSDSLFQNRTCERVFKWFAGNAKMIERINVRLQRRFAFICELVVR